ncbi:helix-turn-helix transcriptional regulator [Candidatus Gracilibacteria bacterium]|jgi:transcriptional regulator with XRE-family HTH domain|nr:helix-turn-helix transcriptional regulator [Candidatus Gracilibacteria bacterium]
MAKVVSFLRRLRRELAAKEDRDVTILEVAQAVGLSRNRLTALELGQFDRISNDELTSLSAYYSPRLGRTILINNMFEIDPNHRWVSELQLA